MSTTRAAKRGKKTLANKKVADEAPVSSPQETLATPGPTHPEVAGTVEQGLHAPGDDLAAMAQHEPQSVTPQPAKSPVDEKLASPVKPGATNPSSAQSESIPKSQPVPPSPGVPAEEQADLRSEAPRHPIKVKLRSPHESPKITAALISDIIEALGSRQHDDRYIADHLSPRSTASELETVWSEDSFDMTPATRKSRGAPETAREVRLSLL
jgi:hypothetical protein